MRALLDTNVVSELRRPAPDERVLRFVREVRPDDAYLSVITLGELSYGLRRLPAGRKRTSLEAWLNALERTYSSRILAIDAETARIWGTLAAALESEGRALQPQDGLIAATALRHGLHLATRNTADFERAGVLLVNPWGT